MKYSLACNWDPALVEGVVGTPVTSLYGGMPNSVVGGGRSSLATAATTPREVANYVARTHHLGMEFNYLLNAACLGNREFTDDGREAIREHLRWVCDVGIEWVTVALPSLVRLIKREFPQLKIKLSSWARVDTLRKALGFAELGVESICLPENTNRDFRLLESMRANLDCELVLIANLGCLYGCPYQLAHQVAVSHASQGSHFTGGYFVDQYYLTCTRDKLRDPAELVKARWIRPEDVHTYEDLGIDALKILDRLKPTASLLRYVQAYAERRYDGNLLDLFNLPNRREVRRFNLDYFRGQEFANRSGLLRVLRAGDFDAGELITLDNQRIPPDFLDAFRRIDCNRVSCSKCGYCDRVAAAALDVDEAGVQGRIDEYDRRLGELARGDIF